MSAEAKRCVCRNPECLSTNVSWRTISTSFKEGYVVKQMMCDACGLSGSRFKEYEDMDKFFHAIVQWYSMCFLTKEEQEQRRTL